MIKYIKTGDIIQGESSFTISGISDINQAHLDDLSEKGSSLLSSATKTTDALTELFSLVTDILNENRKNIYDSTTHLNKVVGRGKSRRDVVERAPSADDLFQYYYFARIVHVQNGL